MILPEFTALIKKKYFRLELCCLFGYLYVSDAIFLLIELFSNITQPTCANIDQQQIVLFENVAVSTCLNCQSQQVAAPLMNFIELIPDVSASTTESAFKFMFVRRCEFTVESTSATKVSR